MFGDLVASSETLFPVAAQSEASLSGANESYDEWTIVRLADGVVAAEPNRVRRASAIEDVTTQDPYIHSQRYTTHPYTEAEEAAAKGVMEALGRHFKIGSNEAHGWVISDANNI